MHAEAWCGTCNQDRLPGGGRGSLNGGMHVDSERGRAMAWINWVGQNGDSRLWRGVPGGEALEY